MQRLRENNFKLLQIRTCPLLPHLSNKSLNLLRMYLQIALHQTYLVKMWGNFATVGGTVVAAQFKMGGNAAGTIAGSIIQMRDEVPTTIDGSADVVIASTGTTEYPPGISFGEHYTPVPGSYLEVRVD